MSLLEQAQADIKAGRWAQAIVPLQDHLQSSPDDGLALRYLTQAYSATRNLNAAEHCVGRLTTLEPQDPRHWYVWGSLLRQLGRLDEAKAAQEKALELRPAWDKALQELSALEAARPQDTPELGYCSPPPSPSHAAEPPEAPAVSALAKRYLSIGGQVYGPYPADVLAGYVREGRVTSEVLVSRGAHEAWRSLNTTPEFSIQDALRWTLLHDAAWKSDASLASVLLEQGAQINAQDAEGRTPLHNAAWKGDALVASLLLEHGAQVGAGDSRGRTPLHDAARQGHAPVASLLLEHGAHVSAGDSGGRTPLHDAVWKGHSPVASLLLEHGAEINAQDAEGCTPLDGVAFWQSKALGLLRANGALTGKICREREKGSKSLERLSREQVGSVIANRLAWKDLVEEHIAHISFEISVIALLTAASQVLAIDYRLGEESTVTHAPADIVALAEHVGATKIVGTHNHPGASATPSDMDVAYCAALWDLARTQGIELVDYVVVCGGSADSQLRSVLQTRRFRDMVKGY